MPRMHQHNNRAWDTGRRVARRRRRMAAAVGASLAAGESRPEIPPVGVLEESYRLLRMALSAVGGMCDVIEEETGFAVVPETRCLVCGDQGEGHDMWLSVTCDGAGTEAMAGPWAFHEVVAAWAAGPDSLHDMLGAAVIEAAKGACPAQEAPSKEDERRKALSTLTAHLMVKDGGCSLMGDVVVDGDGYCVPERPAADGLRECEFIVSEGTSPDGLAMVSLVGLAVANDGVTMAERMEGLRDDARDYSEAHLDARCGTKLFYVDGDSVVEVKKLPSDATCGCEAGACECGCGGKGVATATEDDILAAKAALGACGYAVSPARMPDYAKHALFVAWDGDIPFAVGVSAGGDGAARELLRGVREDVDMILDRVPGMSRDLQPLVARVDGTAVSVVRE